MCCMEAAELKLGAVVDRIRFGFLAGFLLLHGRDKNGGVRQFATLFHPFNIDIALCGGCQAQSQIGGTGLFHGPFGAKDQATTVAGQGCTAQILHGKVIGVGDPADHRGRITGT